MINRRAILCLIGATLFPFLASTLYAQIYKQWDKTIDGAFYDYARTLLEADDGGYVILGYSDSAASFDKAATNYGGYDYWMVKIDSSGNKLFDRSFGGTSNDYLNAADKTFDGGYILVGESYSGISGNKTQPSRGSADF